MWKLSSAWETHVQLWALEEDSYVLELISYMEDLWREGRSQTLEHAQHFFSPRTGFCHERTSILANCMLYLWMR